MIPDTRDERFLEENEMGYDTTMNRLEAVLYRF